MARDRLVIALAALNIAGPVMGHVVDYRLVRWSASNGGDGRLYGLLVSDGPWSWRDARGAAVAAGGDLASAATPSALAFIVATATGPGAFDCAGPWLGGYRAAGGAWNWVDGAAFAPFGWEPGRPAQAGSLESALCLAGNGSAAGTWVDALPGTEAGVSTRSALIAWDTIYDCDGDGTPDGLEILVDPSLDADGNGAIDGCGTPNPADLNGDGRVTGADLGVLLANFNTAGPAGDLNADGAVNGADLGLLLAAWTG